MEPSQLHLVTFIFHLVTYESAGVCYYNKNIAAIFFHNI